MTSGMDYFKMGQAMAGTNPIGDAIKSVLALHEKITENAGNELFKSALPGNRAETELRKAQARYYDAQTGGLNSGREIMAVDMKTGQEVLPGTPGSQLFWRPQGKGSPVSLPNQIKEDPQSVMLTDLKRRVQLGGVPAGITTEDALAKMKTAFPKATSSNIANWEAAFEGPQQQYNAYQRAQNPNLWSRHVMGVPGAQNTSGTTSVGVQSPPMGQFAMKIPPSAANTQMPQFNSTQEADNSGLPVGTIVLVGGRRYQI